MCSAYPVGKDLSPQITTKKSSSWRGQSSRSLSASPGMTHHPLVAVQLLLAFVGVYGMGEKLLCGHGNTKGVAFWPLCISVTFSTCASQRFSCMDPPSMEVAGIVGG